VIGYILTATIDLLLAIIVFSYSQSRITSAFSSLCLAAGVWSIELYLLTSIRDVEILTPLFHMTRVGMFFIAPFLILFSALVTKVNLTFWLKALIAASFVTSTVISFLNLSIMPSMLELAPSGYLPKFDVIGAAHQVNFLMGGISSVAICIGAYRNAIFSEKLRIKWLATAFLIGSFFGVLSFSYSKIFGMIGNVACLSLIAYAILRYRLISMRVLVSLGVAKGVSATALVLGYFGFFGLSNTNSSFINPGYVLFQLIYLVLALELYPRITRGIELLSDKYLVRNYYSLNSYKHQLLEKLKRCIEPQDLKMVLDEVLCEGVMVDRYSVYVSSGFFDEGASNNLCAINFESESAFNFNSDDMLNLAPGLLQGLSDKKTALFYDEIAVNHKEYFASMEISVILPVSLDHDLVGVVLLGRPLKKEQFTYDDIQLLNWMAGEVGYVLEAVLVHSQMRSGLDEAKKTLSVISILNDYNHEVKTPLSNIESLVLSGDLFENDEKNKLILEQARRGSGLVNTMVRTLNGQYKKSSVLFDLNESIKDVVGLFSSKITSVDMNLGELPNIRGYEEDVDVLLCNLIKNSYEARGEKPLTICLSTWYDLDSARIYFSILDNGVGIDKNELSEIWGRGVTKKRHIGGTGIGMSVIKRIVEEHRGEIVVDSALGEGTRFTLWFPEQAIPFLS